MYAIVHASLYWDVHTKGLGLNEIAFPVAVRRLVRIGPASNL